MSSKASSKSLSVIAEEMEALKEQINLDEHKLPLDEFYSRYATDPNMGLTLPRVGEVQSIYGLNNRVEASKIPEWVKLAKNLLGGFSLLLWVACCLSLITYSIQSDVMEQPPYENLALGIILGFIVVITGIYSFYQEVKMDNLLDSLKISVPEFAVVIREGKRESIPVESLVVGDVVEVKAGDRIPADIRIIKSTNVKVDQSRMTGIIEPQGKASECTHDNPLETMNLAFAETYVTEGTFKGVVIRTGYMTMAASMSHITVTLQDHDTLLTDELTWWMHLFAGIATTLACVMFVLAFAAGFHWLDSIILLIGVVMAIIPEGLLAVVLICLSVATKRLYRKNCFVKSLASVEKIGAISALLVDKTGLITYNKPQPSHLWMDSTVIDVDNSDGQTGGAQHYRTAPSFQAIARVAALCNQAEFIGDDEEAPADERPVSGDINDAVLLRWMQKTLGSAANMRNRNRKVCEIPFSRTGKYHLTIHETDDPNERNYVLLMKGMPEEIIQNCTTLCQNGKDYQLDDATKESIMGAFVEMASAGEKIIAFCDRKLPLNKFPPGYPFYADDINFPTTDLRFLGLLSISDPIRPAVPDAVGQCQSGRVRVIMVTGNHPITARAIATMADIFGPDSRTVEDIALQQNIPIEKVDPNEANAAVIHGEELKTMSPNRLDYILNAYRDVIFARTTPQQKMMLVEGLQRSNFVVAATALDIPDVPAMKQADLGIALNNGQTSTVKEAADVVLLDDNFATIVCAIEEGRLVYTNLRKSISYVMASNMPEFIAYVIFLVLGVPLPLGTITILIIDMGTDMVPAISLAFEEPEHDLMKQKPRNSFDRLIDANLIDLMDAQIGMIQAAAGLFSYFACLAEHGFWMWELIGIRRKWNTLAYNDLPDSFGQEWTLDQRKHLEWAAHTSFFISIVMCQWITLLVCRTRRVSLFQHGFRNHCLHFALIFETILALFLVYCPGTNIALRLEPIRINWWITAVPFCAIIFFYDECRKLSVRRSSSRWLGATFY